MDHDDFSFGLLTQDEKLENFEKSTLKLILAQMGHSRSAIKSFESMAEGFNTDWFNETYLGSDKLVITRIFKFNLADVLFKPSKSEVVKYFTEQLDVFGKTASDVALGDLTAVFKVDGVGRMVATTWKTTEAPSVYLPSGSHAPFYITPFASFFSAWLGDDHQDIT